MNGELFVFATHIIASREWSLQKEGRREIDIHPRYLFIGVLWVWAQEGSLHGRVMDRSFFGNVSGAVDGVVLHAFKERMSSEYV